VKQSGKRIRSKADAFTFGKEEYGELLVESNPLDGIEQPGVLVGEASDTALRIREKKGYVLIAEGVPISVVGVGHHSIFQDTRGEVQVLNQDLEVSFMTIHY